MFLGVLVSLGSSGAIANIVAGMSLTYMRAFKVGDRVRIADAVGDVMEKTTFVTRIRTVKNVEVTIPNAMVMSNHIINYSGNTEEPHLVLHTTVTIGYDVDWRNVHEAMIEAALEVEGIENVPATGAGSTLTSPSTRPRFRGSGGRMRGVTRSSSCRPWRRMWGRATRTTPSGRRTTRESGIRC